MSKPRQPDQWFSGNLDKPLESERLDGVAFRLIGEFLREVEDLERGGIEGLDYFWDAVTRAGYFARFQNFARRLGIEPALGEIISRHQITFVAVQKLLKRLAQKEAVSGNELEEVIQGYKKFLDEVKALFEEFRRTTPEASHTES